MQLHVTHVTRKSLRLILKEKHALRYCAAALSTRASLISPSVLTRTPISLPKKSHRLVWVEAQPVFLFFIFFCKNLISCTCHCESCSLVDAAHWKRHHGGKKMRCVSSLIYRISINTWTWRRGSHCCSPMFMLEPCLLVGCRYGAESSQLPGSSSAPTPAALRMHQWLLMPSRGGGLTLVPNQSPQAAAILSGCTINWSGAWLEDRKGSRGAKRNGNMEVHLG